MNEELSVQFKALGHPVRLRTLQILLKRNYVLCGQRVKELSLAQGTVSRHLQILRKAGFIRWERVGNNVYYQLSPESLDEFKSQVSLIVEPPSQKCDGGSL